MELKLEPDFKRKVTYKKQNKSGKKYFSVFLLNEFFLRYNHHQCFVGVFALINVLPFGFLLLSSIILGSVHNVERQENYVCNRLSYSLVLSPQPTLGPLTEGQFNLIIWLIFH